MRSAHHVSQYLKNTKIGFALICIISIIIIIAILINMGYAMTNIGFVFTPILTILLIIIWDGYNSQKKEESLIMAFVMELFFNINALNNNSEMIFKELIYLKKGQQVVNALRPLNNEVWLLLSYNTPTSLYKADILGKLAWIYYRVSDINENIRSRENYRINNRNTKSYNLTMTMYNSSISALTTSIIIFLEEFLNSEELIMNLEGIDKLNDSLHLLKTHNKKIQDFVINKENSDIFK